jgi:hypothetical protein
MTVVAHHSTTKPPKCYPLMSISFPFRSWIETKNNADDYENPSPKP